MKKFVAGFVIGLLISFTSIASASIASASDTIQAYLFPAKLVINGKEVSTGEEYTILNYNGHAYLPIRYVGEYIGGFVDYQEDSNTIAVNFFPQGSEILTDDYFPMFHVGHIRVEKKGDQSVITGLMSVDKNEDSHAYGPNHSVAFALKFYDSNGTLLGVYVQPLVNIKNGEIKAFEGEVDADLSSYNRVVLDTGIFDRVKLPKNTP